MSMLATEPGVDLRKPTDLGRLLVVDDHPKARESMIDILKQAGHQVDGCSSAIEALQMIPQSAYDVIVTDLRMPRMHGHALVVELLERPGSPMIVVLTGVIDARIVRDLITRGVEDIVFKPTDLPVFASKVLALWERRKRMGPLGTAASARREIEGLKDRLDNEDEEDSGSSG